MNEFFKKVGKEIARAVLAALLAALGLSSVGCIACGDGASAFAYNDAVAERSK